MKLDSVVFYSSDIERAKDFYTREIGLELEYQQGDKYASFLFENGVRLGIKKATEKREIPGSQTLILNIEDAEAEYKKAKEKSLTFYNELAEPEWGKTFSILDPDGNRLEYLQRKQRS